MHCSDDSAFLAEFPEASGDDFGPVHFVECGCHFNRGEFDALDFVNGGIHFQFQCVFSQSSHICISVKSRFIASHITNIAYSTLLSSPATKNFFVDAERGK